MTHIVNPLYQQAMETPIRHAICDECETVAHCAANGCIPVQQYDEFTCDEAYWWFRVIVWIASVVGIAVLAAVAYSVYPLVAHLMP